ncbi:MAG: FAD-binding oxidoreductase [Actinomycetes bacterium]
MSASTRGPRASDGTATELLGWGRSAGTVAVLHQATSRAELADRLQACGSRGISLRGAGRSAADAASNGGGTAIALAGELRTPEVQSVDWERRIARLSGGASLADVSAELVARGWFLPVAGRTAHLSVGGAVACDLHGPGHVQHGSIAHATVRIELMTASGEITVATPDGPHSDLFWATFGGMGLTGIVLTIDVRVIAVSSAWMVVDTQRCESLPELLNTLAETTVSHDYSHARLDVAAANGRHGRGVVSAARHAGVLELPDTRRPTALEFAIADSRRRPRRIPSRLLTERTARALQRAWFATAPASRRGELAPATSYFHSQDEATGWLGWSGRNEVVQYQFAVPDEAVGLFDEFLGALLEAGIVASNATMVRFGQLVGGGLSFPMPGWSLALDLPATAAGLGAVLDEFDERLAGVGGRVYLASDTRLQAKLLPAMYPELGTWQATRRAYDCEGRFASDMSRRLGL